MSDSRVPETERARREEEIRFENLERLVDEAGSAVRLARRAGISESYLSRIRHRNPPRISVGIAARLERAMGKPDGWLDEDNAARTLPALTIPLLSWEQAAAFSRAAQDSGGMVPAASYVQLCSGPRTFALHAKDATMAPVFSVSDLVIVDPAAEPSDGKYVLVLLAGAREAVLRQYVVERGRSYLKVLNPGPGQSPVEPLRQEDEICGAVIFRGSVV